jgi:hypothetical protein
MEQKMSGKQHLLLLGMDRLRVFVILPVDRSGQLVQQTLRQRYAKILPRQISDRQQVFASEVSPNAEVHVEVFRLI